jgi:hypothetical protein
MGIAHRENALFQPSISPQRARTRAARSVSEFLVGRPSAKPLVSRIRVNTEAPAQFAPVGSLLHC